MTKRMSVVAAAVTAVALATGAARAQQQQQQTATPGDAALAERLAEMGQDALRVKAIAEPSWRASAAMLEAANRLDPGNARYPRLLVDAELQVRDGDGAIDALKGWLKASPTNVSAQVQLIDLYLSRMESSDAKLAYLAGIIGKPPLGEIVRSHAAARAARLMMDRSEDDQASKMLSEALKLNPLNVDALRMRYQQVAVRGTPLERTNAMLALLRANPAQAPVLAALAKQVADVGLAQASLEWYGMAGGVGARSGVAPSPAFITEYVAEMFIAGQVEPAEKLAGQILEMNPGAVDMWFLKLAMDKSTSAATLEASKKKAGVALSNRLAEVRKGAGQKGATTRPVDGGGGLEVPDLAGDLAGINALVDGSKARAEYVAVLADVAWFQVYFLEQPVTPGVMDFLRQSMPADSVTLARLDGWNSLVQGKGDDAKVKLSAIGDRDPLAKLGVIRLAGKDASATADARKLVNDYPSGLIGAMVMGGVKGPAVQLVTGPHAEGIGAALAAFPRDMLKILDTPQEFYAIRGEPLQIAHAFGEPLLVNVTVQNLTDYDLTVGPDGVIRPDLWFDARLRGGIDQQVPAVAIDRIADAGVLKARTSIGQRVRIDEGMLAQFLSANPSVSVQVSAGVMTNPQQVQGGVAAGPAGYRVQFPKIMERVSTPINGEAQRQKFYNLIANGNGGEKIRSMELLATYVRLIRGNKDAAKEAMAVADDMANAVRTGMSDAEPSVQAWAVYVSALIGPVDQLPGALKQMMADKSWQRRLLALTTVPALTAEQRAQLPAKAGTDDADPVVKAYAKAAWDLQAAAATQPAARPTTAPAADPKAAIKP